MEEGLIPDSQKGMWVTPIRKGKNREDLSDFRPIAITNHTMKVVEGLVRRQVVHHLTITGLLDEQQGVNALRSTASQILDQTNSLGQGSNVEIVYLGFTKEFVHLSVQAQ